MLNNSTVLITGGTGSFGRHFVKYVLERYQPKRLIIYSRDEAKQADMEREFPPDRFECMRFFIGDVRDLPRLEIAMHEADYVIHAAALKHVPVAEYNPFECIHTNVLGAENIVRAAMRSKVRRIVALSTDKACSPVNLYGASKLASDKIFVAANNMTGQHGSRFSVVRYGNVLGSRGSVVPLFGKLIRDGAESLPITDDRMTRFWITLDQSVEFVLRSLAGMQGGEIFVPKIPSMRITDLARAMAPALPQRMVGIRPGEKLHEIMITSDDSRFTFEFPDRFIIAPAFHFWARERFSPEGAMSVSDDFSYASNTNSQWLGPEELRGILHQQGLLP